MGVGMLRRLGWFDVMVVLTMFFLALASLRCMSAVFLDTCAGSLYPTAGVLNMDTSQSDICCLY